jgi:hypothetical protein
MVDYNLKTVPVIGQESRPALGLNQPPIQWVTESVSLGVKLPGREVDHSHPSNA